MLLITRVLKSFQTSFQAFITHSHFWQMDIFSCHSDPNPRGSVFLSPQAVHSPTASDGSTTQSTNFSDEDILLASRTPKKRAGRRKFRETRHPVYRGVRRRNSGKWVSEVREPNKKSRIWLGTFPTAEMAARAHDVAARALRGRAACLNFADSAWRLPVPASTDAKDIQKAATEAAEAFRPHESPEERTSENVFYMDEEAVFGMPGLLVNMAEGMLLPPPHCVGDEYRCDDVVIEADVSLWSYSI